MNDLNEALHDIRSIRRQMAQATQFRGYGPATLAGTGALAVIAAVMQSVWLPDPANRTDRYLIVWISTAILSSTLMVIQVSMRTRRVHSGIADEMIHMAVEQFLPSVGAGALLTVVLVRVVPGAFWMLPGLWQVIFSLGVFSSCRFLPRLVYAAGVWYLFTGLACLSMGGARALSPWTMGLAYGGGQLLVAGILFFSPNEASDER